MTTEQDARIASDIANGRYRIEDCIGAGAMGVVYRAHDSKLDQKVAVKFVNRSVSLNTSFRERFEREIRSLVEVRHPHVVSVFDAGIHEGSPYLVMSYLEGGSLAKRLPKSTGTTVVDARQRLTWLPQVAAALDAIHQKGYVHRDVKPGNILFDEGENAFLADFGVAKVLDEAAADSPATVAGTPGYLPPELLAGQPIDGRTDQFSLAVTTYEALTGKRPFGNKPGTVLDTFVPPHKIVAGIPIGVGDVLMKALSEQPARRFENCQAFNTAMSDALETPEDSPPDRRMLLALGGIVLAALAVVLVVMSLGKHDNGEDEDKDPGKPATPLEKLTTLARQHSPARWMEPVMTKPPREERAGNVTSVIVEVTTRPKLEVWKADRDALREVLGDLSTRGEGSRFVEFQTKDFRTTSGNRTLSPSSVNDIRRISTKDRNAGHWVVVLKLQKTENENAVFEGTWVAYPISKAVHEMLVKRSQSLFAVRAKVVGADGKTLGEKLVGLQTVNGKRLLWRGMGIMPGLQWKVDVVWLSPAFWMAPQYRMRLAPIRVAIDVDSDKLKPGYRVDLAIEEIPAEGARR